MNLIFLGAPGAGKGTQSETAGAEHGIPVISTGGILREAISNGSDMGIKAKEYIDKGELVPDQVVIAVIKERLAGDDCKNGFILDGFPRTVPQAEYLDAEGIKIDIVVDIHVDDEKIVERMGGRRICNECGASYHTAYKPAKNGYNCDKCDSGVLITRDDDRAEVVLSRLETYHRQTEPLKDYYGKKGILKTVIGQEEVADTTALTRAAIKEYLEGEK